VFEVGGKRASGTSGRDKARRRWVDLAWRGVAWGGDEEAGSTPPCGAVRQQSRAEQCSTVQCSAVQCNAERVKGPVGFGRVQIVFRFRLKLKSRFEVEV
jgi:hypothetical protein